MDWTLKAKIIEKFGSQSRFSQVIGEKENKISRVVRGWESLEGERLSRWAKALGCDADELVDQN